MKLHAFPVIALGIIVFFFFFFPKKEVSDVYCNSYTDASGIHETILILMKDKYHSYSLTHYSCSNFHVVTGEYDYRGDTLVLQPRNYIDLLGGKTTCAEKGTHPEEVDKCYLLPSMFISVDTNHIKALLPQSDDLFYSVFGWPFLYYDNMERCWLVSPSLEPEP